LGSDGHKGGRFHHAVRKMQSSATGMRTDIFVNKIERKTTGTSHV